MKLTIHELKFPETCKELEEHYIAQEIIDEMLYVPIKKGQIYCPPLIIHYLEQL